MRKLIVTLFIAVIFLWTTPAQSAILIINGPDLTLPISRWPPAGLQIAALENVTLESFIFQNQGQADAINLTDSLNNVLYAINTPSGQSSYLANVSWSLNAGATYHLLATNSSNGMWANYTTYPTSNNQIQVDGVFSKEFGLNKALWFNFNDITTEYIGGATTPEPSSLFLLSAGILGLLNLRRRK